MQKACRMNMKFNPATTRLSQSANNEDGVLHCLMWSSTAAHQLFGEAHSSLPLQRADIDGPETSWVKGVLNPNKLQYKVPDVQFLGHIFSANKIKSDPDRVAAIQCLPYP
ncbi:hypothetical protein PR048_005525 [Dryococelus australis]|uniref:Uncharacterized protein n=1 Tax=Dryococelus australis TaxID=614101 RepID=A0ABQ9I9I0_9NEOP|nr:hypothetical protein PR048_005525 [Dryococelus australis]